MLTNFTKNALESVVGQVAEQRRSSGGDISLRESVDGVSRRLGLNGEEAHYVMIRSAIREHDADALMTVVGY